MNIGDIFPDVLGTDSEGRDVKLSDFPGKRFIVYFYPKDNTPGCTAEACSLRDGYESWTGKGYVVIGVSKDSAASHQKFAARHQLPFILIADTDHRLCEEAGREYMGIVRTTFVLDENHEVTHIINKVNTKDASGQLEQLI